MPYIPRRLRLALVCCAVGAVASASGGIFTFPILSPALSSHLKLTQPQLTTIVLAGVVGQYPFAFLVGKFIDTYGPWACSLMSSILFSSGFGLFAWEIAKTPNDITLPSQSSFHRLTMFYFMCGLGTAFGLFSSLFAASKNFPQYLGIASGASMAMFGLSPLFLSYIASGFFSDSDMGLNVTAFVTFMAVYCGSVNAIAAILMRLPSEETVNEAAAFAATSSGIGASDVASSSSDPNETDPLLPKGAPVDVEVVEVIAEDPSGSTRELLKDPCFWLLAFVTFAVLGSCEMVIANIGSVTLSLPSAHAAGFFNVLDRDTDSATATQVRAISLANTISRLVSGPLADFTSPIASYLPSGVRSYPRKHWVSRMSFVTGATILCMIGFVSLELVIRSQASLWWLSICTGTAYGVMFTILPSILSTVWGADNVGRNFGIITYAAFAGTPVFSYLYAFVSELHAGRGVCTGTQCWSPTFWVVTGSTAAACLVSVTLWRRWRGVC